MLVTCGHKLYFFIMCYYNVCSVLDFISTLKHQWQVRGVLGPPLAPRVFEKGKQHID